MMVKLIIDQFRTCKPFGSGILIPGSSLEKIYDATHIFTGFDEMWCFDEMPRLVKPNGLWIVAPLNIDKDDVPSQLPHWMKESGCRLGLGDGIGLNYATPDKETARDIDPRGE